MPDHYRLNENGMFCTWEIGVAKNKITFGKIWIHATC